MLDAGMAYAPARLDLLDVAWLKGMSIRPALALKNRQSLLTALLSSSGFQPNLFIFIFVFPLSRVKFPVANLPALFWTFSKFS